MESIIQILIPLFLLILAFFTGRAAESWHLRSLERREMEMADMLVTNLKSYPRSLPVTGQKIPTMVIGQAVIATDYLKSFIAGIVNLLGGELKSYQTLIDRARREATCRMMEKARAQGFDSVCNIRLDTCAIGGNDMNAKNKMVAVALLVSGTAYCRQRTPTNEPNTGK